MGIKGIYKELGPGKRVSLSKLTADSLESLGRPLRIAIDIAIWQYQTQAARGGTNPAIRTLFYRLTRLLSTPIQPIFVFDGPHKPAIKRNKRSGRGDGVATAQAKRLIRLFGFAVHDAPGEAEAECALLQQHGIVDAVLSEDVDTIMFGCTKTLRNWVPEGRSSKTPTHVTMYDVDEIKAAGLGLDREGMVLVALMSGGDYLPDGIPGCGVKVACEAARAGYGKSVCRLKSSDSAGIRAWRESLAHELYTNEKGHFRVRHKALSIPEDFPNMEVLRYYTHPVVSRTADLPAVRQKFDQRREMQLDGLREFTRETFDWDYRIGAVKFIRVLGKALLTRQMTQNHSEAGKHVQRITGRRTHFSTDGCSELRVSYIPGDVVPIDLTAEVDEVISSGREGLALNSDEEFEPDDVADVSSKSGNGKALDVSNPELAWVLESLVRGAAPSAVASWEEAEAAKALRKSPTKKKATTAPRAKKSSNPQKGAMDQYVKTTKTTQLQPTSPVKHTKPPPTPPTQTSPRRPALQRPQIPPPPSSSKPSTPSTTSSLTDRSNGQRPPETIVLSSSPACEEGIFGTPGPRDIRAGEAAGSVRAILAEGRVREEVDGRSNREAKVPSKVQVVKPKALKQTSLDLFATRREKGPSNLTTPPKPQQNSSSNEPIIIDSSPISPPLPPPVSPSKRTSNHGSPPLRATSPSPTRTRPQKKKLFVPRTSAPGFYETIEAEEDDLAEVWDTQTRRLEARGVRAGVVRFSDVSEIDLTQED
ncbi:hypothetical protein NLU13_5211 [Sarocladium strictum]|uniref:Uncharacterized protein n=1 Tax=Sarocladium strictum TaxID=5046 RepID=A0AA39L7E5_SARSR|nr:hypothetical protein NLU13_5211 [Sarocladium strictum]